MLFINRLFTGSLLFIFLITLPLGISAQVQEQEKEKEQEVTEEFFYAEEEVEIASLKPQPIEEAPGIVSVITAQQIKDMGARDLNDLLRFVPGFQLTTDARWYATTYGVRGIKQQYNTNVLLMIDGVPLNEPYYGQSSFNWGDMPLNNVKRIEIIRGPGSAIYGTYAFLAVINVITKKAEDIDGIEFSAGGGSWSTQQHYMIAGKKINDFSISGSFDYCKSEGYENYYIQQDLMTMLDNMVPFLPSASMAPGLIQIPLDAKRADIRIAYKDVEFQFKLQDHERGMPTPGYAITDGFSSIDKSYIGQTIYNRDVGDKFSFLLKVNYYYRNLRIYGQAYPRGIYGPLIPALDADGFYSEGLLNDSTIKERNIGIQSHFNYELSDKNMFNFGIEFSYYKTDKPVALTNIHPITRLQSSQMHELGGTAAGLMDRAADRNVVAFFIQDSWDISQSLNLTAGLRVDNYSDFGTSISPRISLIWKLLENTNIKLLYGHAFRAPTFSELYQLTSATVGNDQLGAEKIKSFEIGINQKAANTSFSINYFYNSLADLISPAGKTIYVGYPPQLENSGKVHAQGIEAEFKANFKKNTYAYFNYSYAKAKDELTGEVVPNVANNLFNFGVNVGAWKYLNANLNVNYVGERKRGMLMGFPDPRDPVMAYSLSDLTLRAQNFWKNTEIILSIHNLFNTEYKDPEELGLIYNDLPHEGRQILGKVIFKF
jgi:outer membrane receptor for ferrienterochelin and colicins